MVEHGKPMLFGKELDKGLILNGLKIEVVQVGENGVTTEDILIHDAQEKDKTLHQMLIRLDMPVVLGVIRAVEEVSFHERMAEKTALAAAKSKVKTIDDLLYSGGTYDVT